MALTTISFAAVASAVAVVGYLKPEVGAVVGATAVAVAAVPAALGFTTAGIAAGSVAAGMMGPAVAAGSAFSVVQSLAATGALLYGGLLTAGGAVVGCLYAYFEK